MNLVLWIKTADNEIRQLQQEVASVSPWIQKEILHGPSSGSFQDVPIVLPKQVGSEVLNLITEYCCFHRAPGRSDKERKIFDEKFIRMDTRRICELTSAADALEMKPLVDLASRALARMIEGKTADEIRATFHLPDDLTEEEKLEPLNNVTDDPRIRLLNRLYARKRRELAERKSNAALPPNQALGPAEDSRPLEELLSFIEQGDGGQEGNASKSKNKRRKGKSKARLRDEGSQGDADATSCTGGAVEALRTDLGSEANQRSLYPEGVAEAYNALYLQTLERLRQARLEAKAVQDSLLSSIFQDIGELDAEAEKFSNRLNKDWEARITEIMAMADAVPQTLRAGASFREPDEPATRGCEAVSSGSFCIAEPVPVGRESPDAGTCSPDLSDLDDVSDEKQLGEQDACPAGMMAASRKQKDVIVANPALELCRAAEWSSVPPKLKETEPLLESTPCIGAEADAGIHHQPGNSVQDTAVPSLPTLSVADTCAVAQAIQDFLDHIGMGQQVHVAQLHGSAQHERIAREFQRHADNLHWEVELQSGHTMTLGWKTCKSPR